MANEDKDEPSEARQGGEQMSEAEIDYNLMESFPASDPPSWTLGVRPHKTSREEFEGESLKERSPHRTTPRTKTNRQIHRNQRQPWQETRHLRGLR